MKKNGVSFRHAVELLREGITNNASLAAGEGTIKRTTVRTLDAPVTLEADDQKLLNQVIDYSYTCLKHSPRPWPISNHGALPRARPSTPSSWALPTAPWGCGCRASGARRAR